MKSDLIKFFTEQGERIHATGDTPILLENGYVWYISEGDIDIFSVKVKDRQPVSSRYRLFRIMKDNLFFPLTTENYQNNGFIAVGSLVTYLYRIKHKQFLQVLAEQKFLIETASLIDNWVTSVSACLKEGILPSSCVSIQNKIKKINSGVPFKSGLDVLWCRLTDKCVFPLKIKLYKTPPQYSFPVSARVWIRSDEEDIEINPEKTRDILSGKYFSEALLNFNYVISEALMVKKKHDETYEKERLLKKNCEDSNKLENSMLKIASVFQKNRDKSGLFHDLPKDSLLAACCVIGKAEGITFTAHSNITKADNIESKIRLISEASNIKTRKVLLKDNWYRGDSGPMLAFEQENLNPVALLPDSPRKYSLYNPQKKQKIHVNEQVSNKLTPFGYTFYRPFPERELNYKDIFSFSIKGNVNTIVSVILLSLIAAVLGLITPLATGYIFDTIIPEAARNQLLQVAVIVFTSSITISLLAFTKSIALLRFSSKVGYKTQAAVWDRLLSLPVKFFKEYTAGDLAQRSMGIDHIRGMIDNVVMTALTNSIFSIGFLCLLFYYSVSLALVGLTISAVLIIITTLLSLLILKYQKQLIKIEGEISGIVLQFITGISKLRISGAEDQAFCVWADKFTNQKIFAMKAGVINNVGAVINSFSPIIASMIIFAWVILSMTKGSLSPGEYMAFNSAYLSLQSALLQMSATLLSILSIIPVYKRLKPILTELPEVSIKKPSPGKLAGNIEINNVSFKYDTKEPDVLRNVSLSIKSGDFVAIVGSSGSGKSTLMRLLLGFEKPDMGTIYYDNNDISSIDIKELRRQLGVVLQNSNLMQGSIYKNIIGASPLSVEDAWEAAVMAGCDKDIKEMPMGMHTVISTGGGTISGGQKQRIMIARALVKKPGILLFDEATSALDNKTQAIVSKTVKRLQITRIVIAHRLSTIINADKIFVLKDGKIAQQGKYKVLIKEDGPFGQLARRQMI